MINTRYINDFCLWGSLFSLDLKSEGTQEGKTFCTLLYMSLGTCHTQYNEKIHPFSILNLHFSVISQQYGGCTQESLKFALLWGSNLAKIGSKIKFYD